MKKIKSGDALTVASDLFSLGVTGRETLKENQEVIVEKAYYTEGHFSTQPGCKDIWIDEELKWVKLKGITGHYLPGTFKELRKDEQT